jgi:medium-chain acyl-[acyl-carrier-protein] hydrolase
LDRHAAAQSSPADGNRGAQGRSLRSLAATSSWIVSSRPKPQAGVRLFCLPCAGAGASRFASWSAGLGPEVEVCPLQPPGREERLAEPAFTRLGPFVAALADAIDFHLERPYALFGHSLGALVAFELTRALRRAGRPLPVVLFVAAFRAPHLPDPAPPLHDAPLPVFRAELQRLNGTPAEVLENDELMRLVEPTLRADFAVHETYVHTPEPPLSCPISVLGGLDDREVDGDGLAEWRRHTDRPLTLRMLPGDHFFVGEPLVLEAIARDLERFARR